MENLRSHRYGNSKGERFLPAFAGESERGRCCDNGGQILPAGVPGRCLFPAVWQAPRLPGEDSSISARMACMSSVAQS